MTLETWLMFSLSAFLIAASPGPSVLHAVRYASLQGLSKATASILGNTIAILLVCAMASAGLAIISHTIFFKFFELGGSAYLIYLGLKIFLTAGSEIKTSDHTEKYSYNRIMLEAFTLSLANPKILIFIASFFPQFIRPDINLNAQFIIMSLTFAFFTSSTLFIYTGLAIALFKKPTVIKAVDRISGVVLIFLGLQMFMATFYIIFN